MRLHWTLFLIDLSVLGGFFGCRLILFCFLTLIINWNLNVEAQTYLMGIPLVLLMCNESHYFLIYRTADGGGLVEKHYVFLKRLCQVLCALGNQLCALLVSTNFRESFRAIWREHLESCICVRTDSCHWF